LSEDFDLTRFDQLRDSLAVGIVGGDLTLLEGAEVEYLPLRKMNLERAMGLVDDSSHGSESPFPS
jgi:hypothetical protein